MKLTSRRWRLHVSPVLAAVAGCFLAAAGCADGPTEVMIGVATDIPAPGSLGRVDIDFTSPTGEFEIRGPHKWFIDPSAVGHLVLPGSFGIYSTDGSEPTVRVSLRGYKNAEDADATPIVVRTSVVKLASEQT